MIENIIFYSVLAFLSIPFVGMTWNNRNEHMLTKQIVAIALPLLLTIVFYSRPEIIEIFDIRNIFSWLYQPSQIEHWIKKFAVTVNCFTLAAYLVNFMHIVTSGKKA
jgi:uncharacterized membrane protein